MLIGLLCTCMVMLMIVMESFSNQQEFYSIPNLVNVYSLGQQKRLENNNNIREKLASVIQRKMIPAKFLQEESCEIETALYYIGNHKNITIENYKDPFASK